MLPLWSFGTWMSRITYFSQEEGLEIAKQLRNHRIPADVIHFDTGWFDVDWQCDYEFSKNRFKNPVKMVVSTTSLAVWVPVIRESHSVPTMSCPI